MSKENSAKVGTCHACGGTVSKTAKTCPHCGEKRPYRAPKNWKKIWIYSLLGFVLFGVLPMVVEQSTSPGSGASSSSNPSTGVEDLIRKCEAAIRSSANNPSTIDIHRVTGFGSNVAPDGTRRITQTFSAKNGFGLEQTFDAYCSLTPAGKFDFRIAEQG